LGLAGLKHVANKDRSLKENVAMITDLIVAVIAVAAILMQA
jgi:predicted nucleic acid-binding Zn ribbon protein